MAPKYSVIIPAYNAEKTIARCLDSLLDSADACSAPTEIILVNDGSSDGTSELCRDYAFRYPQIRYFSKSNGGVSTARNLGLAQASGKYVLFVDSDDFVAQSYFSGIEESLHKECEFLMFGNTVYDGAQFRENPLYEARTDTPEDTAALIASALVRQQLNAPCSKLFRRDLIEKYKIQFDERLPIGEDKVFVVSYVSKIRNAVFTAMPAYIISVENKESLSRKSRENLTDHILLEHQLLFEIVESCRFRDLLKKSVSYSYHRSAYTVIRELYKFDYSRSVRREKVRDICTRYAARRDYRYTGLRHWLMSIPIRWKMIGLLDRFFLIREGSGQSKHAD